MGRPRRAPLLPLPWSEAHGRVLAAIVLAEDGLHLRAIADRTGLPYSVVQREVDRLERGDLVSSTKVHTARVVSANTQNRLYPELRALLLKAYGPREVLEELLVGEESVAAAYLFGSWAARYEGQWGEGPADIDVLIVGTMPAQRVDELEAEAEERLGQPVQITVVPRNDWRSGKAGFVRTVRQRSLVPIAGEIE
jgi:predicted nucleotidyltransferase